MNCVMHKCINGQTRGGNEKHVKYVITRKFYKIRGEFKKVGGNKSFFLNTGKCTV